MTFLFKAVDSGEITYVNAHDLLTAIENFQKHYGCLDQEKYRIYVRIQ